jgi:hypothetical protein
LRHIFYTGLKDEIKNLLLGLPKAPTLVGLLKQAITLEARILERRSEQEQRTGWVPMRRKPTTTINFAKLSYEERLRLMKEGRCFICRQTGHLSKACPKRGAQIKKAETETEQGENEGDGDGNQTDF